MLLALIFLNFLRDYTLNFTFPDFVFFIFFKNLIKFGISDLEIIFEIHLFIELGLEFCLGTINKL